MRRLAVLAFALLAALSFASSAFADPGDVSTVSAPTARIGERLVLQLEVRTPKGAAVEIVPGGPSWNRVEVIETRSQTVRDDGDTSIHTLKATIAPFLTGELDFVPVVSVTVGSESTIRRLPLTHLTVPPVLAEGDPLELSPLAPPVAIAGAESPFLRPALVVALVAAILLALALAVLWIRQLLRRPAAPPAAPAPTPVSGLSGAEQLLATDPVAAYRGLASLVRSHLALQYGFPALALTTNELHARMEAEGVDRWQARLAGGLLEECDAVVYAGYRPAGERRIADLNMAREIVEVTA